MTFCNDIDLLHWEPNLFKDAAFASQLLLSGAGDLAATAFTISAGSLAASHVQAGHVLALEGTVAGSYPIVSIDSDTVMTLSVLYDGLFPADGDPAPSPVATAAGLSFAVRTFGPQRQVISDLLQRCAGVGPEISAAADARIINTEALRRPCVLGTLQMVYSALAAAAPDTPAYAVRAELYERLYRRALQQTRVEIDLDGDGREDTARVLSVIQLRRV